MTKTWRQPVCARQIEEHLRSRFPAPEWATFFELRDAAGFDAVRSIDCFAMNTWPSKGLRRVAVEIKVSRGDFFRELDNPAKREHFEAIAHEFYFAAPSGLIKPSELPEGIGLLEATEKTLRQKVRAKQTKPEPIDDHQLATILRAAATERENVRRSVAGFAEFQGRTITLDDLRQLAEKWNILNDFRIRSEIRAEVNAERRKRALSGEAKDLQPWSRVLMRFRAMAREALGRDCSDSVAPEEAMEWLGSLQVDRFGRVASMMRDLADEILGAPASARSKAC